MNVNCIYEVKVEAEEAIAEAYFGWLTEHLQEVVAAAGFSKGEIYALEGPPAGFKAWVCHYHARHREQIESYLQKHAPRLRADGVNRFGNRFRAERRILIFQKAAET